MAINLSNHLKAMIYPSNILAKDICRIPMDKCFTVLHFNYECKKERNQAGFPFGDTTSTILSFTIKLMNPEDGKLFYQQMQMNEPGDYTFLFNAELQNRQVVTDSEDAMVVCGYVVDVKDDYSSTPSVDGSTEQMQIHVKLLVANITYIGTNGNRYVEISRKIL